MKNVPNSRNHKHDAELVWFRISVVVASAGYCAGQVLLWLKR